MAELEVEERARFFYAFLSLANRVAVADRLDLGDAETLPSTLEKAASVSSRGLDFIASETGTSAAEVLRRAGATRLFRVGVNLDPEGIRPSFSEPDSGESDEEDEAQEA